MRIFDLTAKMQGVVRSIVDEAWDRIDQSMADVLLNGWDTSYTDVYGETVTSVCADSAALFAATHDYGASSATTFTNIMTDGTNDNPTLSRAAIVNQINAGMKYTDANGLLRPFTLDTVLVGPDLIDSANRIVHSEEISGSANWDPNNFVKGTIKQVLPWARLAQTGSGTSRSAYWFMYASRKVDETLKLLFKERPSLDAPESVHDNLSWDYVLDYYYTLGRGFPPYLRGSTGLNA